MFTYESQLRLRNRERVLKYLADVYKHEFNN